MKTLKYIIITILLAGQVSCIDKKFQDEFKISITPNAVNSVTDISVKNSATNEQINDVEVSFIGAKSDEVYTIGGTKEFNVDNGFISVGIHKGEIIDESDPIEIDLLLKKDGYLDKRQTIFFNGTSNQLIDISMVKKSDAPTGVKFATSAETLTGGKTSSEVVVKVEADAAKQQELVITLPENTSFLDRKGNTLSGNDLIVDIGSFDPSNSESTDNYPGGFLVSEIDTPDGESQDIAFVTAGFTTLNMTVGGEEVKSFDKPISVCMDIDPNTINPETNQPIQEGETIDIWSYDEEDAKWVHEKTGTVGRENGKLCVVFETTHLSFWNLDYFLKYEPTCRGYHRITLNANETGYYRFQLVPTANPNQSVFNNRFYVRKGQSTLYLNNAPNLDNVILRIYDSNNNTIYNELTNLCKTSLLNLQTAIAYEFLDVNINLECEGVSILPSVSIMYKETGTNDSWKPYAKIENGQSPDRVVKLDKSKRYDFGTYYNGWKQKTNVELPSNSNQFLLDLDLDKVCEEIKS
ncbi:hypothetical protein [Wenyingzhuangia aestuarii]|uniref:hypothetical protein n=1 Tax=Wenyingzhuangia aestuarii TaxID=1647582 RepID=UPI0014388B08|nr:hypothetical protein [Wenyingzhuangia aestuarii]NJB82482.1 hypothetical protein [Wenyingzhuangia aestuarii]